jgi:beta-fructofuranosidase
MSFGHGDDHGGTVEPDPHRPAFHLTAPSGWLNDPNGLCEWDGAFHLFYQYNPDAPIHGNIHWGHATSTDLIHWRDEPVALAPSSGPDAEGCWSGVLVDDGGTPTLVYSGHTPSQRPTQTCCIAVGSPDLLSWTKLPDNPVIDGPPAGVHVTEFRDHTLWRDNGHWHQAIGSGVPGQGGALLHYSSPDLRRWEYEGPLLTAGELPSAGPFAGTTWECPDLFRLDSPNDADDHVLVFSAWDYGRTLYPLYLTGRLVDGHFEVAAGPRNLDLGLRHFYAPQSFTAADGRRIQFGWAQEARPESTVLAAGWAGVMSLPRVLSRHADGSVLAAPASDVAALRTGAAEHVRLTEGVATASIAGDQLDLTGQLTLPPGCSVEVAVRATDDLQEATVVRISRAEDGATRLELDRSRSRHAPDAGEYDLIDLGGELPSPADDRVSLRILVDHSMLEVFANGVPLTARIYPASPDATRVQVTSRGTGARVGLSIWRVQAAFGQRAGEAAA